MGFSINSNIKGSAMNTQYSTCLVCNSQFKIRKNKANKYCGMSCYRVAQKRGDYIGKKAQPIGKCLNCESDVYGSFSKKRCGEKSTYIFCNRLCYDNHRSKIKEINFNDCACCGKKLGFKKSHNYKTKYCNNDCRNEHNKSKDRNCISCGIWFSSLKWNTTAKRLVADNARKTCSNECYINNIKNNQERKDKISKAFTASKHPNWQGGSQLSRSNFRGYEWRRIRLDAIERDGFRCVHCGIDRESHFARYKCDFNVNHIKPFHQFGGKTELANKLSNLETLCKSCHTKADWKYRKENHIQLILGV